MDVVAIEEKQYCIAVLGINVSGKTECEVLNYLDTAKAGNSSLMESLASIFERYALQGRHGVTKSMFHEANSEHDIWQFRKGDHRIFCFRDPDEKRLVLLTHGNIKSGKKANKADVLRAIEMRRVYLVEKKAGNLRRRTLTEVLEEQSGD